MTRWLQALLLGCGVIASLATASLLNCSASAAEAVVARPTPARLASSRETVRSAIQTALARYPGDIDSAAMLRMLQHELADHDVSIDEAASVLARLGDGRGFLSLPEFVKLREQLQNYLADLRLATEPGLDEAYRGNLNELQTAIQSGDAVAAVAPNRWLAERGLALAARSAAASQFARNNVVLRVSAASGNKILPNPFTQSFSQTTDLQGTPATVRGTLVAHSQLYAPDHGKSADHAGIDVRAVVNTQIGISRQRVSATAAGTTHLNAQVLLQVRNNDFHIAGTSLQSSTSMSLGHVSTQRCLGNRVINRLAGRVFDRKRGEINAQADQQIVAQGKPTMIAQVATVVEQINAGKNEVIAPIVAYGLTPALGVSSDSGGMSMTFRVSTPLQLAAQSPPPVPRVGTGSYLAVHESAANNAGEMFAGLTIDEQKFRETVFDSLGFTPVETTPPPGGEVPHTVTFSRKTPLTVQFFSDQVKVRMAIDGLSDGREKFIFEKPVTVDVVYRFESHAQGVLLVREAMECHVEEPQKTKFEATLGRFLVPTAKQDDLTTLGQLLSIVQLRADTPTANAGWLQMPLVER